MIRVNILSPRFSRLRRAPGHWNLLPLCTRQLRDLGLFFQFYSVWTKSFEDCDVAILSSHNLAPLNTIAHAPTPAEALLQRIEGLRESTTVIWSDESDSSGTCQFEVLPYVDAYWKKQLLRNRNLYQKCYYSQRIHFDYWIRKFNLRDTLIPGVADDADLVAQLERQGQTLTPTAFCPLRSDQQVKLQISWNLGYHDWRRGAIWSKVYWQLQDRISELTRRGWRPEYLRHPTRPRNVDVVAMLGGIGRGLQYARDLPVKTIASLKHLNTVTNSQRISRKLYLNNLLHSKLALSLYGKGEICLRDFETFCAGAALVMPSMDHLETFPSVYDPWETYVPIRWDYSDLRQVIHELLRDRERRISIAETGQARYLQFLSQPGVDDFGTRLFSLIQRARALHASHTISDSDPPHPR